MHYVRNITSDLYFVGADERRLNLFENIHPIPNGVSYNSYLLLDEKTVLCDTVDWSVCRQFLENIEFVLDGRQLDYLFITHVEPDHSASIEQIILRYPDVKLISTKKAFDFMKQFGFDVEDRKIEIAENATQCFGKHTFTFKIAPMVHWPEVVMAYDDVDKVIFSSDAFGTFGALNGKLFNDEFDFDCELVDEGRRYYTNIVGKYGPQVQAVLKKLTFEINYICPLHGPVWRSEFDYILDKYNKWSTYTPEENGVLIIYASMYGNTETGAITLASKIVQQGIKNVKVFDVSRTSITELVANTFRFSNIVIASPTYNMDAFPLINNYLHDIKALNVQNRTFSIIENGTWASVAGKSITKLLEEMKNITIIGENAQILSAVNSQIIQKIENLADVIVQDIKSK